LIGLENGLHSLGKTNTREIFLLEKILTLKNKL